MRVPMKERQRKKQQKRDAEKEKSGRYLTSKDLVTEVSYVSYNNEPLNIFHFTIATSEKGE